MHPTAPTARPDRAGGVRVHVLDLSPGTPAALAAAAAALAPHELARARRGTPAVQRRRLLRRAALRRLLAAELGVDPAAVPLTAGPTGRPQLPAGTGLDVSAASSGDLGVVAVGRGVRVGVDVERVRPWSAGTLDEGWLDATEQAALRALPGGARAEAATRAWTRKEAVLKGRGTGLAGGLAGVRTPVGRGAGTVAGWSVHDVPVPAGWVASVAVEKRA